MKTGIELIAAERERQINAEGWTAAHDDSHTEGELANAAISYLDVAATKISVGRNGETYGDSNKWPWELEWFNPSDDPIRNLVKAGALIAAEIDRLQRASDSSKGEKTLEQPEPFSEWPRLRKWLEMDPFIRGYMSAEIEAFDAMSAAVDRRGQ